MNAPKQESKQGPVSAANNSINPYDEVLYPGYPFPQTHPDRLATLATLFGIKPAPVEASRVLELGCGDGANLIPTAFGLPGSEFVGIDLAGLPIAKGQAFIEELGLKNIALRQLDVLDVSSDLGGFDYIIVHGLYSWVPANVQDKILSICKMNLAPLGVAFVSYNTYPGWYLRRMTREMMLFHLRGLTELQERTDEARGFIKSLSESQVESEAYGMFLKKEFDRISTRADGALYHDDLAEINTPVYFYQFMEHAARHGLQYLTEARLAESAAYVFPAVVTTLPKRLGSDVVSQEQYFDFLKCRMFRQTLLCHDDIALDRSLKPEQVRKFYMASSARPVSASPDVASPSVVEEFRAPSGVAISTDYPLAKAAILHLGEIWPQSVGFEQLLCQARTLVGADPSRDAARLDHEIGALYKVLLATYASDLVEFHVCQPGFITMASERPVVSPLARLEAQRGRIVTTPRHTSIEVKDDLGRRLLLLLDGTRDRAALLRELNVWRQSGEITMQDDGHQPPIEISLEELEQKLSELGRLALLVA